MRPFEYSRPPNLADAARLGAATGQGQADAATQYLAGGTTLIDLMKLDVLRPRNVVDLRALRARHNSIAVRADGLHLGAFASMAAVSEDERVRREYPVIADSLKLAASAQLRNMATLGGNVLQKTRCPFYRDPTFEACNKRTPGSGCQAIGSFNRNHAVLGTDASCISQYPGDLAVALIALDATVQLTGPRGERSLPFAQLHIGPAGKPHIETSLRSGEIITAFHIPAAPWYARSLYLKVRDRASYEFALASCAVALELEGDQVRTARLGLGGLAYKPWRAHDAEQLLVGKALTADTARAAGAAAMRAAVTHGHNDFKRELGERTIVRALLAAKAMPLPERSA
jgi:xanthine dehydrogenase YagS FAD-binding subunit